MFNNNLFNTPRANRAQERIATKLLAKILQKELILADNKESIISTDQIKMDIHNCYDLTKMREVFILAHNTEKRLLRMFKILGHLHGREVAEPVKRCKSIKELESDVRRIISEEKVMTL